MPPYTAVDIDDQPAAVDDASPSSYVRFRYAAAESQRLLHTSYRRFYFWHVLALVPTLAILTAALVGTLQVRQFCHLQNSNHTHLANVDAQWHSSYERGRCRNILDRQLLLSTLLLGLVGWLASYTSRKACWALADRLVPNLVRLICFPFSSRQQSHGTAPSPSTDGLVVTSAIAVQAVIAESLRVLSFYWACCILVTALYLYPKQEQRDGHSTIAKLLETPPPLQFPNWAWRLSFRDPRFFVAAWSSIAWALAEFGFGAYQILHQVGLYRPFDRSTLTAAAGNGYASNAEDDGAEPALSRVPGAAGKAKRSSPSQALEQARQKLMQPFVKNAIGSSQTPASAAASTSYGSTSASTAVTHDAADAEVAEPDERSDEDESEDESLFTTSTLSILDQELEDEVDRFLFAKERAEVEAILGVPLPEIPVALCALWRIDAMLWSIGSSLLLSSSFTHAQGGLGHLSHSEFDLSEDFQLFPPLDGFGATFAVLVVLHTIVSTLWATSLPSLGFAATTYASLLFGLGIMIAALARWGLLI